MVPLHRRSRRAGDLLVRVLTPDRMLGYLVLMTVSMMGGWLLSVVVLPAWRGSRRLLWPDFVSFYSAGSLFLQGRLAEVYDLAAQREFQSALFGSDSLEKVNLFLNPPFAALFYAPFAMLSFGPALLLWWGTGLVALGLALELLRRDLCPELPHSPLRLVATSFLFYPTASWFMYAQTSSFSLLVYAGTFVLLRRRRDFAAGVVLGCLAYKPQLALGLGCLLLWKRRWWTVAGAAASVSSWIALGFLLSPDAMGSYLDLIPRMAVLIRDAGYPTWGLASLYGCVALLLDAWWPSGTPGVSLVVSGAALGGLAWVWSRTPWDPGSDQWDLTLAGTLAWGLLVSPHLYHYDLMLLLLPIAVVWVRLRAESPRWTPRSTVLAWTALLWMATFAGHYLTRLQLALADHLALPGVALQLTAPAVAAWGVVLIGCGQRSGRDPAPAA